MNRETSNYNLSYHRVVSESEIPTLTYGQKGKLIMQTFLTGSN